MHEINAEGRIMDPYKWMQKMSEEERKDFNNMEIDFYNMCMLKFDMLHK